MLFFIKERKMNKQKSVRFGSKKINPESLFLTTHSQIQLIHDDRTMNLRTKNRTNRQKKNTLQAVERR